MPITDTYIVMQSGHIFPMTKNEAYPRYRTADSPIVASTKM